jgi:hypothetical protein
VDGLSCDMCGNELLLDDDVRYVAEIQVYAAYDPLEITASDLRQDFARKIRELIEKLKSVSAEDAESSVYQAFTFDLCARCKRKYASNPLRKPED